MKIHINSKLDKMPEFAGNYLGYLLARCSYEVSAKFHQKLREEGVSVISWRILASIQSRSTTVNELAKMVLVNQSTLSKALDRIERDGLIVRERDPDYRSKTNIKITLAGKELIDHLIQIANQYERQSFNNMEEGDVQELHRLLQLLVKR